MSKGVKVAKVTKVASNVFGMAFFEKAMKL
jgi:hypothetical protein